jgi:hypothetical protein
VRCSSTSLRRKQTQCTYTGWEKAVSRDEATSLLSLQRYTIHFTCIVLALTFSPHARNIGAYLLLSPDSVPQRSSTSLSNCAPTLLLPAITHNHQRPQHSSSLKDTVRYSMRWQGKHLHDPRAAREAHSPKHRYTPTGFLFIPDGSVDTCMHMYVRLPSTPRSKLRSSTYRTYVCMYIH